MKTNILWITVAATLSCASAASSKIAQDLKSQAGTPVNGIVQFTSPVSGAGIQPDVSAIARQYGWSGKGTVDSYGHGRHVAGIAAGDAGAGQVPLVTSSSVIWGAFWESSIFWESSVIWGSSLVWADAFTAAAQGVSLLDEA
jgi:hypothetical protein